MPDAIGLFYNLTVLRSCLGLPKKSKFNDISSKVSKRFSFKNLRVLIACPEILLLLM